MMRRMQTDAVCGLTVFYTLNEHEALFDILSNIKSIIYRMHTIMGENALHESLNSHWIVCIFLAFISQHARRRQTQKSHQTSSSVSFWHSNGDHAASTRFVTFTVIQYYECSVCVFIFHHIGITRMVAVAINSHRTIIIFHHSTSYRSQSRGINAGNLCSSVNTRVPVHVIIEA